MIGWIIGILIYWNTRWLSREALKTFGAARSSQWSTVRAEHLKKHPKCAVCGRTANLAVHHKKPFHLFPELELEPTNLVTLCESPGMHCHITFGHLGNFRSYNPDVDKDVEIWHEKVMGKPLGIALAV